MAYWRWSKVKLRLLFSIVIAFGAVLVNWLFLGDSSPLHQYFLRHGSAIQEFWLTLNLIPVLFAGLISHNHGGGDELVYMLLLFAQWLPIAFVISTFLFRSFGAKGPF